MLLQSEMRNHAKSLAIAYLMLLGGHLGAHRFYLKRYGTGILQLILFLVTCVSYFLLVLIVENEQLADNEPLLILAVIFTLGTFLILTVWVIVDLFLVPKMVRAWNDKVEQETIKQIIAMRK